CALLQLRLQGPRPSEMARRRLSHPRSGRRRAGCRWKGGQRRGRGLGDASLERAACPSSGAQVAQLVEHVTENHGVGGSIPPLGTTAIRRLMTGKGCETEVALNVRQCSPTNLG